LTFWRILILTALSILAFAGNSLLSRAAFTLTEIDANSFTLVRLTAGALTLLLLVWWEQRQLGIAGSWPGTLSLFGYAIWYRVLPALSAMQAASVQLAVPVVAAILAVFLLAEPMHSRLLAAGGLVLSGLGLVLLCGRRNVR
jgi:drug/metabolite transporter (DMT)-like permease